MKNQFNICTWSLVGLFLFTSSAWGQITNRFSLDHQKLGDANNVSTATTSAQVAHRMFLDEDGTNLLTIALGYSDASFTDEEVASGPDKSRNLRSLVPNFNLMRIFDDEYSLVLTLRPGLYGDLQGDISDDFRLEGGFVITKFMTDNLTMGLGLGRGANFGRDLIVPLVQFLYFASDKIVVRGLLPIKASLWYIPDQTWEFGAIYRLQGSLYNIEDDTNIPDAKQIGFAAAHIGGAARYKITGNHFLFAEAGFTALRRYEWSDDNAGPTTDFSKEPFLDKDLDNVPYLRLGWIEKF